MSFFYWRPFSTQDAEIRGRTRAISPSHFAPQFPVPAFRATPSLRPILSAFAPPFPPIPLHSRFGYSFPPPLSSVGYSCQQAPSSFARHPAASSAARRSSARWASARVPIAFGWFIPTDKHSMRQSNDSNESPNHALQRTATAVTARASAAAFPPTMHGPRQPPPSLSLGSLGVS